MWRFLNLLVSGVCQSTFIARIYVKGKESISDVLTDTRNTSCKELTVMTSVGVLILASWLSSCKFSSSHWKLSDHGCVTFAYTYIELCTCIEVAFVVYKHLKIEYPRAQFDCLIFTFGVANHTLSLTASEPLRYYQYTKYSVIIVMCILIWVIKILSDRRYWGPE